MSDETLEQKSPLQILAADPAVYQQVKAFFLGSSGDDGLQSLAPSPARNTLESIFNSDEEEFGAELDVFVGHPSRTKQLDNLISGDLPNDTAQLEAIIRVTGRPPLLVQHDNWNDPVIAEIKSRLDRSRENLQPRLPAVGRIEFTSANDPNSVRMVGTGWFVGEQDLIVTNRHVAKAFAKSEDDGTRFVLSVAGGRSIAISMKREYDVDEEKPFRIEKVLWMAEEDAPCDMAFLKVNKIDYDYPEPLQLMEKDAELEQQVATIGYPAEDPHNDTFVMLNYFENIYEVKRLSPGQLIGVEHDILIEHDCTTLGGSSGAAILDLETGHVVGLHFAGSYKHRNLALKSKCVKEMLAKL